MEEILRDRYLSPQRFGRYLRATSNNEDSAKKLYTANLRLAQSFHPLLSQFEVVLRNALNALLADYFSDPDWIIHQTRGFMSHPSLASSGYFMKECVVKSQNRLLRQNVQVTAAKIISDQMFAFWLAFYVSHHYSLIQGQSIFVFPYKPASEGRASLYGKLDEIIKFRNRMNHCEPLCFRGHVIDCSSANKIHSRIYDFIRWMNPELIPCFEKIDKEPLTIDLISRI